MKSDIDYKKLKFEFHGYVGGKLFPLKKLQQEDNQISFNELMDEIMPQVKIYLNRQLKIAEKNKSLPAGKYSAEGILNEIYIDAFENIHEVKEELHLHRWLFSKSVELLKDIINEEDLEHTFLMNIDRMTKVEWESMIEKFSTDGDGDLVMLEELDDAYSKENYILADVFIEENEQNLLDKLSGNWTEKQIQKQIKLLLELLPFQMRSVFELNINQQFDVEEIAKIKEMPIQEVEELLTVSKDIIREYFEQNHSIFEKTSS